jgi:hypothetical protein
VNSAKKPERKNKTHAWLTLSAFALGILMFFWLPVEDTDEKWVLAFAAAVNTWFVAHHLVNLPPAAQKSLPRHILGGMLAGLAITPVALFLMAFKTGMHGHGMPDFSAEQILSVVSRTPIWGSAGLLLGLVSGFIFNTISK